jgi:heme A synthase
MTAFQRLCLATCGVIFLLIVIGGVVRATDSGLGCPDWPTCHGRLIPSGDKHTIIEYSHRLTASIAGTLVLAIAVVAWRRYREVPAILWPALGAFVLVLVQAGIGAAVVAKELPPGLVTLHLVLATGLLTLIVLILTASFEQQRPLARPAVSHSFGGLALVASGATLALMLLGSYVAGAGYGLACNGWPLCNGEVVPSYNAESVQLHFAHRFMALVVGLLLVGLLVMAWRGGRRDKPASPSGRLAANLTLLATGVFVIQSLIGAANIWTRLADEVSAVHLGGATLLWLTLAVLNIRVHRLHELLPYSTSPSPRPSPEGLAGAPR